MAEPKTCSWSKDKATGRERVWSDDPQVQAVCDLTKDQLARIVLADYRAYGIRSSVSSIKARRKVQLVNHVLFVMHEKANKEGAYV